MKLEFFAVLWWHEGIHFSVIQSFSVSTDRSKEHVTVMGNPCIVLIPAFLLLLTRILVEVIHLQALVFFCFPLLKV